VEEMNGETPQGSPTARTYRLEPVGTEVYCGGVKSGQTVPGGAHSSQLGGPWVGPAPSL
jgi:hypothetical protein